MIWYVSLDTKTEDTYKGKHQGQSKLPDAIVTNMATKIISAATLYEELKELKQSIAEWKYAIGILTTVAVSALLAIIGWTFFHGGVTSDGNQHSPPTIVLQPGVQAVTNQTPSSNLINQPVQRQ
jgi:hypothetical protein